MTHLILKEENSFSEIFTKYLKNISQEIEAANLQNTENERMDEHLHRIDNAIRHITEAKLEIIDHINDS